MQNTSTSTYHGLPLTPAQTRASREHESERRPHPLRDALLIIAGCIIAALSFTFFLRPNSIAPSGVVGVSLVLGKVAGIEPAYTQWTLNLIALALGTWWFGRDFMVRSLAATFLLPLVVFLTRGMPALTLNPLLAAICGGVGVGLGVGLVFRAHGSIGGFSTLALALQKSTGLTMDKIFIFLDGLVVLLAVLAFSAEQVLCALVCIVLAGRTIRGVLTGFGTSKVAMIVSTHAEEICGAVLRDIPLGVTKLAGQGGYTGEPKQVLMTVMRPMEIVRLKQAVRAIDPAAFMILCDASEVLGYGFKPHE
ncbi:MAG TPA: YitT family protein [Lacunisphaera sp.]|nr:YitT family protein [Lacunisphaera sp.]